MHLRRLGFLSGGTKAKGVDEGYAEQFKRYTYTCEPQSQPQINAYTDYFAL